MTDPTLPTYRLDDGIAVITLDDGKANVFSTPALEALEAILDQVEADAARALVIVGRPGRFSAGFNLAEMTESVEGMRALVARGARWWLRLYGLGIPTVAAGTGHALAGGAITLLSCDVRFGADIPCKIGLNEVSIGMPLPIFAVELARERLTKASFTRSTMGAQVYDPAGAAKAGYLDEVVPEADLLDTALAEARRLGELRTGAYARTKQNARAAIIASCLESLDHDMSSVGAPTP
ncbi:crotonase/enoyl-CoA hydratase family protein [Aquihabitans sp. G128]|uniref:crotonase/enoyl-CoA hydratase family protein n=1 Tax=Aquihabitans sp. G128 TaxID=2849779 RepID=UPI001C22A6A0|nr:crotonase/enoyl-CoA hydratase family protein [Aquihabitans sp. G128]QXC63307.1 crotonase/enoyl-CoA hydratase family protein [Aquihabitans sp. G128]